MHRHRTPTVRQGSRRRQLTEAAMSSRQPVSSAEQHPSPRRLRSKSRIDDTHDRARRPLFHTLNIVVPQVLPPSLQLFRFTDQRPDAPNALPYDVRRFTENRDMTHLSFRFNPPLSIQVQLCPGDPMQGFYVHNSDMCPEEVDHRAGAQENRLGLRTGRLNKRPT